MKKEELAVQIKKFMYDFTLSDIEGGLRVVSPSYLKSVLYSVYSQNSKENPYSIVVGDFNKLNKLNKEIGMERADECIRRVLKIIKNNLPPNAIICRNGGDEFLIIIPGDAQIEQIEQYIKNALMRIDEQKDDSHDLTISLDCGNWTQAGNIKELHAIVDKKVNKTKLYSSTSSDDEYDSAYSTLHDSLRLGENFSFSYENIRKIINITFDEVYVMLSKYKENPKSLDIPIDTASEEKTSILNDVCPLDRESAICFNNVFLQSNPISDKKFQDIPKEHLETIARDLVFCFEPSAFSRDYFNEFLIEALLHDEYKLHFLNLSGLKLVNLIYGHSLVDEYLHKNVYSNVRKMIDEKVCPETTIFSGEGKFYKIYLGGGDILVLEAPNSSYEFDENFESELNARDDKSILSKFLKYFVIHSNDPVKKENFSDFVLSAKQKNDSVKDELKKKILENKDNELIRNEIVHICILSDLIKYCKNNPSNYMDSENLRNFLERELRAMFKNNSSTVMTNKKENKNQEAEDR